MTNTGVRSTVSGTSNTVTTSFSTVTLNRLTVKPSVFRRYLKSSKTSDEVSALTGVSARTVRRLRQNATVTG